jgi:hypothetical protein
MAQASARRSFHGPLLVIKSAAAPRRAVPPPATPPLELVAGPPTASSVGGAVSTTSRSQAPSVEERQRVLHGVLMALRDLTTSFA